MASKKAKTAQGGYKEVPKKHYCSIHDEACKIVKVYPGGKIRYNCPQNHQLTKQETILK